MFYFCDFKLRPLFFFHFVLLLAELNFMRYLKTPFFKILIELYLIKYILLVVRFHLRTNNGSFNIIIFCSHNTLVCGSSHYFHGDIIRDDLSSVFFFILFQLTKRLLDIIFQLHIKQFVFSSFFFFFMHRRNLTIKS